MSSEKKIINNNDTVIVCFGGMALKMGGILPFEFLKYLSKVYEKKVDLIFYIDKKQCWYHKGIEGISKNIDETASYLKNIVSGYKKTIFMGVSSGGYASILFGSLCNTTNVVAFIPPTTFKRKMVEKKYFNLKNVINKNTKYLLNGDPLEKRDKNHFISECYNLNEFDNVEVKEYPKLNMKVLRNNGTIKDILDKIIYGKS